MGDTPRCILCDDAARPRFRVNEFMIYRCDPCDLEFVWPTPTPEVLASVYASNYFTGEGAGYRDYFGAERDLAMRKAAARLDALASLGVGGGRLLDFGCASGFFVEAARGRSWDAYGVEPSSEARHAASPCVRERIFGRLEEARAHGPFDVVTLWDVLEHLPSPLDTLRALRGLLRPGGIVGVVVPVLGSVNTRLAPATWDQYKPPEHLWYFSRRAVRSALLRACGATVILEEEAWRRPARFVDPAGTSTNPLVRMARPLDVMAHRMLSVVIGDELVIDSMAFYARG